MNLELSESIEYLETSLAGKGVAEQISILNSYVDSNVVFSSSLGLEDQVITDIIATHQLNVDIFTIDTGRLFKEVYDLIDKTNKHYKLKIRVYFPDYVSVENLTNEKGPNSFYDSIDNRIECCNIRKVEPLRRALASASVWITGLRRDQSANRENMKLVQWDSDRALIKFNPLIDWTSEDVMDYIEKNEVPINPMHQEGFVSIGCAPCTRAISLGEDPRSGRWWWETSHKECGLHK